MLLHSKHILLSAGILYPIVLFMSRTLYEEGKNGRNIGPLYLTSVTNFRAAQSVSVVEHVN